jgi:hypothetical protein
MRAIIPMMLVSIWILGINTKINVKIPSIIEASAKLVGVIFFNGWGVF